MSHAPARPRSADAPLYHRDLYAWSLEQVRLLKARQFGEIDAENIAEEILDVAKTEYRVLESALRVLLMHILKWEYQPERRSRSWENTISEHRFRAERQLRDNPSLKARLQEAIDDGYYRARLGASSETDMDVAIFPENCPYDWDAILNRPFKFDESPSPS